jgi:hypothetical protein
LQIFNAVRVLLLQYNFSCYFKKLILCQFRLVNILILYIETLMYAYLLNQYTICFLLIWTSSTEELITKSVLLYYKVKLNCSFNYFVCNFFCWTCLLSVHCIIVLSCSSLISYMTCTSSSFTFTHIERLSAVHFIRRTEEVIFSFPLVQVRQHISTLPYFIGLYIITTYLLNIYSNILLPSSSRSYKWLFSEICPKQNSVILVMTLGLIIYSSFKECPGNLENRTSHVSTILKNKLEWM